MVVLAVSRRTTSTDSRAKRASDDDMTSRTARRDVIVTSSPMSSSMPHLGPRDKPDTIQPINHIYWSSSAALTGCHGDADDEDVSMATRTGRHKVMTSRDSAVEQCYWSCRRQSLSTASNNRCAFS